MLRIALCDENLSHLQEIEKVLTTILFDRAEFDIKTFGNGIELVESIRNRNFASDLLILDVNMKKINGLRVAKFIRENKVRCDIVFLTANRECILDGYRYNAFDYLLKPVSLSSLQQMIDRYIEIRDVKSSFFYFKIQNSFYRADFNKIEFFAGAGRKTTIYSTGAQVSFYHKIDDIEQEICKKKNFLRPHQSYIVNIDYITEFSNNRIVMESGTEIPVAQKRYHETKEKFTEYISSELIE